MYIRGMKAKIRHLRLNEFYTDKVMNSMIIVMLISLMAAGCTSTPTLPVCCAALALALAVGYALWFWIKKPDKVVTNKWLSEMNGLLMLYFLITAAMDGKSEWWYIFPVVCGIATLFTALTTDKDETVDLTKTQDDTL